MNHKTLKNPLEGVDIESEYQLIQEKKSNLSRSLRDLVIKIYPDYILAKNSKQVETVE